MASTVLVQGLAVLVILLLTQVAFASYVRTMSVSAASEGARRGGLLGGDQEEARARTSELSPLRRGRYACTDPVGVRISSRISTNDLEQETE